MPGIFQPFCRAESRWQLPRAIVPPHGAWMSDPISSAHVKQGASLEVLLGQVALGSREAFEKLYRETSRKLFGICLRVLGERSEAEDALQEAFTAVWRKAAQFDPTRASPIAWLAMALLRAT